MLTDPGGRRSEPPARLRGPGHTARASDPVPASRAAKIAGGDAPAAAVRVLQVSSHPIQYHPPIYRLYAADPRLSVTVAYCSLQGAAPGYDRDFGLEVAWDVPLLEGYSWVATRNWSTQMAADRLLGLVNPGLWRVVRQGRFDVVIVPGYRALSYWIAAMAGRVSGSAVVLGSDATSFGSATRDSWKVKAKALVLPWLVHAFDGLLVPSTAAARFARDLGVPAERVFMAHYVIDNDLFRDRSRVVDREAVRLSWAIPDGATIALFCGKLVPWKRPGDLLAAAAELDDVHVVYAGDGILRSELEHSAATLGMTDRVRFLGFVNQSELPAVYRAADVLVLPSAYEPFGLVVNEAFACGVPAIVSSACGCAGDLVRDGLTGYVVRAGDVETITSRLRTLAADPATRRAMGEHAATRLEDWGPKQHAEAFTEACVAFAMHKTRRMRSRKEA